ncbi:MAG: ABC transporter permease [Dehalococcoidia bacterium]
MNALRRTGRRIGAFLVKESVVALGQPRLILFLIVGPFLLLFLFGIGFRGRDSDYSVVLVVPDSPRVPVSVDAYRNFFQWSLHLTDVTTDEAAALARLERGEVDIVAVAPRQPLNDLAMDNPAVFQIYYNHLDPLDRAEINGLAFGHTREMNVLLVAAMLDGIFEAAGVRESGGALSDLRARMLAGDSEGALGVIDRLLAAVVILRLTGEGVYGVATSQSTSPPTTEPLTRFETLLRALRAEVSPQAGLTAEQEAQLGQLEETALLLPDAIRVVGGISPERLAAPVDYRLTNLAPTEISVINFAAPVVLALLVQHVAVTLVSLSVIRERTRGTVELFAVAPVQPGEILLGKALSMSAILAVLALALILLMALVLGVPVVGSLLLIALILALLIVVSLAIGFILAALSSNEPQTVQLAMLTLLFAIFFGGLFIPVESVEMPVRAVSWLVPVTHAGAALRAAMLRGDLIPWDALWSLVLMALVLVPIAYFLTRRSYRVW